MKISLTAKRSEFTDVQKLFLLWREIEDKIDHYVSYRVFSCVKQQKMPATEEITSYHENQITPKQTILATDFR